MIRQAFSMVTCFELLNLDVAPTQEQLKSNNNKKKNKNPYNNIITQRPSDFRSLRVLLGGCINPAFWAEDWA